MRDFAAIDFETANGHLSSVCSVGIVIVRDRVVTEKLYHLIRPEPDYYSHFNTLTHGLTATDTEEALSFPRVWSLIAPQIDGIPLVAHNSPFDEGCLRAVHKVYGMDYPDYTFYCTCRASRRLFGKTLPNHKLKTVASHCGFDLTRHHHALADAEACAWITTRILDIQSSCEQLYFHPVRKKNRSI